MSSEYLESIPGTLSIAMSVLVSFPTMSGTRNPSTWLHAKARAADRHPPHTLVPTANTALLFVRNRNDDIRCVRAVIHTVYGYVGSLFNAKGWYYTTGSSMYPDRRPYQEIIHMQISSLFPSTFQHSASYSLKSRRWKPTFIPHYDAVDDYACVRAYLAEY
ncbi:hypothetical protein EDC04DRAFT_383500 [Pisolithus marmoratus]|nr:hypothetical protein EDC04DRAFT_383500 [Pisolithus marmoratus]